MALLGLTVLLGLAAVQVVRAAEPSNSKLSIHLITNYTSGAQAVINAHPRVLKIFFPCVCVNGAQLQAASDYKAGTPSGKVVLRIYTVQRFSLGDDPTASAVSFWNNSMAPAFNAMTAYERSLIDYVEGPNEGDNCPTFESLAASQWFGTFWLELAQLIADNAGGAKPMMGSIAVGNPPGDTATIHSHLDNLVPALRLCQSLGGGWTYHDYSAPNLYSMPTDLNVELYYSLRYRMYYDYFATNYPDLSNLPLIGSEGGGFYGWTQVGATAFQNWLVWHDAQTQQDPYFLGDTLFQIGDPYGWGDFELEPIAGWLADTIAAAGSSTLPDTPTGVVATGGDTEVSLTWNEANGATSYKVRRSTTSGGPYSDVATGITNTYYTNTGLTNGIPYYYVVAAHNAYGDSANSAQTSATPQAAAMNTNTPTGTNASLTASLVSTDSNYSGSFGGALALDGSLSTKWCSNGNAPPHWIAVDLGSTKTVNGFIARLAGAGGEYTTTNFEAFKFQAGTSLSGPWTDEASISNGAQANVIARSYNTPKQLRYLRLYITDAGVDNYARLYEFEIYTASIPAAPTGLTPTPGNSQVSLSWTASAGATSYNVKRSTTSGGPYTTVSSPTGTSYTNTGLTNGTTYYYVVTAVNSFGESGNSSQVSATPQQPVPAAPTGLAATARDTTVSLNWNASTGATSYNLKRSTTSGGPYTTIQTDITSTGSSDSGLVNGTTYYYVVSALNASGESANSSQTSATPQSAVPPTPTGLTASAGDAQVTLSWTASANASSYNVKRSTTSGGPYTTVASPTTVSYTNSGLTNGTTYYYVVSAVNSSGESANTSQVSATPVASGMNTTTPTGTNAALSATQVSTDSNYSGSFAGTLAVDGSMSTKWCSNGNAPPHWIAIDLGSTKTINGFIARLAGAGGEYTSMNFEAFKFQSGTSISGPWTDEATISNSAQANVIARSFNTPKPLRYLRLYITDCGVDNYARFYEFEIYTPSSYSTVSEDFGSVPNWTSSFDASWGSAATWSAVSGGQSGNALQATRSSQGSSAKVKVFTISPNTAYTISGYVKCPSYTANAYWAEFAYRLGGHAASDFDGNVSAWTQVQKFSNTGTNGNGNTWVLYQATFNSGSSTQISVGFKTGSSGGPAPTVLWDTLRVQ